MKKMSPPNAFSFDEQLIAIAEYALTGAIAGKSLPDFFDSVVPSEAIKNDYALNGIRIATAIDKIVQQLTNGDSAIHGMVIGCLSQISDARTTSKASQLTSVG